MLLSIQRSKSIWDSLQVSSHGEISWELLPGLLVATIQARPWSLMVQGIFSIMQGILWTSTLDPVLRWEILTWGLELETSIRLDYKLASKWRHRRYVEQLWCILLISLVYVLYCVYRTGLRLFYLFFYVRPSMDVCLHLSTHRSAAFT